jgi:hypothetical protein
MPQVAPIIPHEVQTGEEQKWTNNLQQNSRKEECQIENVDSMLSLDEGVRNLNFNKELHWNQQIY